jgi:8-oxo-dGTP pyrophosphatase MutT (NUDIX family)
VHLQIYKFNVRWSFTSFTDKDKAMRSKVELSDLLLAYNVSFPGEEANTKLFSEFLERNNEEQLYTRKNFDGHITTSAFIVDAKCSELLLLRHKSLNRWLQPGGHTEGDQSLLSSALREAIEETGMTQEDLVNIPVNRLTDVPFDIDSHYIPPNPRKGEDGHYHHDFRYLFLYNGGRENAFNTDEATGMQWVTFDSLNGDETFAHVVDKIRTSLLPSS